VSNRDVITRFLCLVLFACCSFPAFAQEITVVAAADLQPAFREIVPRFESANHTKVKLSFGSSGNITSQIQNGAPYDAFFSADIEYPRRLDAAGLVEPGSLYEYAVGRIVLWLPGTRLDPRKGLHVLLDPSVRKIAIANPQHAPYGRAAIAALRSAGIYEQLQPKFVFGENVSQAAQFVQTGNADAGIIALSLALSPAMKSAGRYYEIDPKSYPELRQAAVVLRASKNKSAALAFMQFIKSEPAKAILRQYGFTQTPAK
jgi:molybdate transport system substrate-binding protein